MVSWFDQSQLFWQLRMTVNSNWYLKKRHHRGRIIHNSEIMLNYYSYIKYLFFGPLPNNLRGWFAYYFAEGTLDLSRNKRVMAHLSDFFFTYVYIYSLIYLFQHWTSEKRTFYKKMKGIYASRNLEGNETEIRRK